MTRFLPLALLLLFASGCAKPEVANAKAPARKNETHVPPPPGAVRTPPPPAATVVPPPIAAPVDPAVAQARERDRQRGEMQDRQEADAQAQAEATERAYREQEAARDEQARQDEAAELRHRDWLRQEVSRRMREAFYAKAEGDGYTVVAEKKFDFSFNDDYRTGTVSYKYWLRHRTWQGGPMAGPQTSERTLEWKWSRDYGFWMDQPILLTKAGYN